MFRTRVTLVVSVLCRPRQHPLTLAMSGRRSWARKASLRDLSNDNIRGKHSDLDVASVCQQMLVMRVAGNGCNSMFLVPVRLHSGSLRAHLHVAQVNKRLVFASVPSVLCRSDMSVSTHIHGRVCCLVWLFHHVERSRGQSNEPSVL